MNRKYFHLFFMGFFGLMIASATNAQDTETRSVSNFDGIAVSASVNAKLVKGSTNQVELSVDGIELEEVRTEIKDGILQVGIRQKSNWSWGNRTKVNATITYTDTPNYISVSSSADVIGSDVIVTDELELKASSSGDMKIEIEVAELIASVSSSGDLQVGGSAGEALITASSSGDFMGRNLVVGDAIVKASSSGDAELTVKKAIKATASSSGDIVYHGNPSNKDVNKSSGGDVRHKN